MELNHFMVECMFCPETTQQKLESQRIYLSHKTMGLREKIYGGVASINPEN